MIHIDRDISSSGITEDLIAVLPALCTVYCSSGPVDWYERQLVHSLILLVSFFNFSIFDVSNLSVPLHYTASVKGEKYCHCIGGYCIHILTVVAIYQNTEFIPY